MSLNKNDIKRPISTSTGAERDQKPNVLKELGLKDSNQWILYEEKPKKFFEHITDNLDDDNVLTDKELKFYEDLVAAKQFLEGDSLSDHLKSLEFRYSGISTLTDNEVDELELDLRILEADTKDREERILRMKETQRHQLNDIVDVEKRKFERDYQETQITESCILMAQDLSNIQESNKQKISQLNEIYKQPLNPPAFMYQMPLEQHFHKCEQMLQQFDNLMRKNFNITCSADETDNITVAHSGVVEIKKRLLETEKKNLEDSLTLSGFVNIIESIDRLKSRASADYHEMRALIDDIEAEIESVTLQFDVVHKEAQMLIEQKAEQDLLKLFNDHLQSKNKQLMKRVELTQTVLSLVDNSSLLCELLWITVQLDLERVVKTKDVKGDQLDIQTFNSSKRMRCMKNIAKRNPQAAQTQFLCEKLRDLITQHLPVKLNQLCSANACIQEIIHFEERCRLTTEACISHENVSSIQSVMNKMHMQSEFLRDFIFNGPTNRPSLYDTKFAVQIFERDQRTKEVDKMFKHKKSDYKKFVIEPWQTDKFYKMEQNLWIYFLTEKEKVLECIEQVKKKAAEKGTQTFRALNINVSNAI